MAVRSLAVAGRRIRATPRRRAPRSIDDRSWRWVDLRPGARADAGAERPAARSTCSAMSFHNVTWAGGQRDLDAGRLRALRGRCPTTRCSAPGSSTPTVFALGAVAGQMVLGFVLALLCSRVDARPGALPRDLHPADPDPRHRHRRHLEADAQLRFRPRQPGDRPRRPRAARLARRPGDGAALASSSSTSGTGRRSASCCSWPASNPCRRTSTRRRKIDGASAWQELVYVTLPMMMPTILVTFAFRLVLAFKVFDEVYLLTERRPGHRDRGGQLHALPALLHRGPRGLRRRHGGRGDLPRLAAARRGALGAQAHGGGAHERARPVGAARAGVASRS